MAIAGARDVRVGLKLEDHFSPELSKAYAAVRGFGTQVRSAFQQAGRAVAYFTTPLRVAFRTLTNFRNILLGSAAAFGAFRFVNFVADVERTDRAFKSVMQSIGADAPEALEKYQKATKGTVDEMSLMQAANRAVFLGVGKTSDEIANLMDVARRLGKVMGRDALQAFEDLSLGIGRQSRLILDNLGIIVRVEDANRKYAEGIGKTTDELTDAERRQAFFNAVMDSASEKLARLGEDTDGVTESWGRLKATFWDLANTVARALSPALKELLDDLTGGLEDFGDSLLQGLADASRIADIWIPKIVRQFDAMVSALGTALGPVKFILEELLVKELQEANDNVTQRMNDMIMFLRSYGSQVTLPEGQSYIQRQGMDRFLSYAGAEGFIGRNNEAHFKKLQREYELAIQRQQNAERRWVSSQGGAYVAPGGTTPSGPSVFGSLANAFENAIDERKLDRKRQALLEYRDAVDKYRQSVYGSFQGPPGGGAGVPLQQPGALDEYGTRVAPDQQALNAIVKTKGAVDGLKAGLFELQRISTDTFSQMADAVLYVGDSIATNFSNELTRAIEGTQSFGQAFSAMAKGIIRDIVQMTLRMAAFRVIGMGASAIGGLFTSGDQLGAHLIGADPTTGQLSASGSADLLALAKSPNLFGMAEGGIAYGPTITGEGGVPEAYVPLPDGRRIPVAMMGGGGASIGTFIHIERVEATDAQSFEKRFNSQLGRSGELVGSLAARSYQGRPSIRRNYQ